MFVYLEICTQNSAFGTPIFGQGLLFFLENCQNHNEQCGASACSKTGLWDSRDQD